MRPDFERGRKTAYFDNAATTFLDEEVLAAMRPYLEEQYGNPSSVHLMGRKAAEAVETAREQVAELLGVPARTIHFTSGGTEANNWVLRCARSREGVSSIMCSAIEHPSVRNQYGRGFGHYLLGVGAGGVTDLAQADEWLASGMRLASLQYVNHEVGTVQPVEEMAALCKKHDTPFHVDAVQAFGKLRFTPDEIGADFVTVSAHKIHGPMGVGALYVRDSNLIQPLLSGGGQEGGLRSGTLNVPAVVGFGEAAQIALSRHSADLSQVTRLSKVVIECVFSHDGVINGDRSNCSPYIVSATFPGQQAVVLAALLDNMYGMSVSCGSACSASQGPSETILAMGMNRLHAESTLRISLGRFNTERDVQLLADGLFAVLKEGKARSEL